MDNHDSQKNSPHDYSGYIFSQIFKALDTAGAHTDNATRERALSKIDKWKQVLSGLNEGTHDIGSRTPLKDTPAWVTPEVVTGGFVTGNLLAGGPLSDSEREWLARLPLPPGQTGSSPSCTDPKNTGGAQHEHETAATRYSVNTFFLSDSGQAVLGDLLQNGCYDIGVPEEGALLITTWLLKNGHAREAWKILEQIEPYFARLRFFPIPTQHPQRSGLRVYLETAGQTKANLERRATPRALLAQREAVTVWTPFYDTLVALFLETVEGDAPVLESAQQEHRHNTIRGGYPCQRAPAQWWDDARAMLEKYATLRKAHPLCGKPESTKHSLGRLLDMLRKCCAAGNFSALSARDIGWMRLILARSIRAHGRPGSPQRQTLRAAQHAHAAAPLFCDIARVLARRLEKHPGTDGVDDVAPILSPVQTAESAPAHMPAGTQIPPSLGRKIRRCAADSIDSLVMRGLITSSEVIAQVMPRISAELKASGINDPALRKAYAGVYRAFRKRRSLLLLNLETQVHLEELPWIAALGQFRATSATAREIAAQTFEDTTMLALTSFPHAIIPNKLLRELKTQAKAAEMDAPLTEELAADIFMGKFSEKFSEAMLCAAAILTGTAYARYYAIDYPALRKLMPDPIAKPPAPQKTGLWSLLPGVKRPAKNANAKDVNAAMFLRLCEERAGVKYEGWKPVVSGMLIEQQQILTTQNLAVLHGMLRPAAAASLKAQAPELARQCFAWVCRRQQVKIAPDNWHASLLMVKNTAYAWRQMWFFASLLPEAETNDFAAWSKAHFENQPANFKKRFKPVMEGFNHVMAGGTLDAVTAAKTQAKCFIGWTNSKPHWLLGA